MGGAAVLRSAPGRHAAAGRGHEPAADLAEHEVAARALFELDEDGFLCRLGVAPLDRQATRELAETIIGRPPPAALVDWVGQRSRGNPLYVISLLRALLEERADLSAPSLRRLPEGLTERMAARTRSVDPGSQAVLELLAVFERPLPVAGLLALTGLQLDQLEPILADLVDGRAVVEGERGRELSYEVSHPLLREVVYQEISGTRKRVLHRQVARSLLDSGRLAEAALHFARSAEPGDDEAVRVLLDAMRQAEQREAFRETLDLLWSWLRSCRPPTHAGLACLRRCTGRRSGWSTTGRRPRPRRPSGRCGLSTGC